MTTTNTSNSPSHHVYAVTKFKDDKSNWAKIGAVWPHGDGKGFSMKLDLLPTGQADLVIRVPEPKTDAKGGAV